MSCTTTRALSLALLAAAVGLACASDDADPGSSGAGSAGTGDESGGSDTTFGSASEGGSELSGEELYLSMCSVCHGPAGEGSELGYEIRHHTPEHLLWVVRNGRPGAEFENSSMPPFAPESLADVDVEKIVVFLDELEQPTEAEALYLDYCANCHGPDGDSGVANKEVRTKGFNDVEEKVRRGVGLGDIGVQNRYMPAFDDTRITDDELRLIVDFLND